VERLADADGDEGLCAEALHGEGHGARVDVPDRAERLEDPHPLSLSAGAASAAPLLEFRFEGVDKPAGGEGFRAGVWEQGGAAPGEAGRNFFLPVFF
jgi:hypothetical protein